MTSIDGYKRTFDCALNGDIKPVALSLKESNGKDIDMLCMGS